jgi:hypothetical protein
MLAFRRRTSADLQHRQTGKIATSAITRSSVEKALQRLDWTPSKAKADVPEFALDGKPNAGPASSLIIELCASSALLSMSIENSKSVFNCERGVWRPCFHGAWTTFRWPGVPLGKTLPKKSGETQDGPWRSPRAQQLAMSGGKDDVGLTRFHPQTHDLVGGHGVGHGDFVRPCCGSDEDRSLA